MTKKTSDHGRHADSWPGLRRACVASTIASLLLVRPVSAQPDGPNQGLEGAPVSPNLVEQAREAYVRRDFVAAARMYEILYADTGAAKYLFNAGISREAAGNDGMAIRHWDRYLCEGTEIFAEERTQLAEQISAARRRTMPVRIVVDGPQAITVELRYTTDGLGDPLSVEVLGFTEIDLDPGTWSLRVAGSQHSVKPFTVTLAAERTPLEIRVAAPVEPTPVAPPSEVSPPPPVELRAVTLRFSPARAVGRGIAVKLHGPVSHGERTVQTTTAAWNLVPGAWTVTARARGYLPREVELGPELPPEVNIRLEPDRQRRARIGVAISLGAVGLGAVVGGAVGEVLARREYHRKSAIFSSLDDNLRDQGNELLRWIRYDATGVGVLATGVGLTLPAVTLAAGGGKRSLLVETGIGAGLTLAGAIGVPLVAREYARKLPSDAPNTPENRLKPEDFDEFRSPDLSMAATLGLGLGMFVGAIAALLTRPGRASRHRPVRDSVRIGSSRSGISVGGRF